MAGEWKEVKLGDLIKVKHGYAFKSEAFTDTRTEWTILTPGNFEIGGGFKYSSKPKYYSELPPEDYIMSPGDLVVTMTDLSKTGDTLGYSALIPNNGHTYLHNQRVGKVELIDSKNADQGFIYWLMRSPAYRSEILASATGTGVKHTAPTRIENYQFQLPPLPEQKAIADVLSALDDKIELNRKMNETLEGMARALFKDWFIDFGPVKAKMAGQQPLGLAPDIAALFPDALDEEGIPEGWKMETLGDVTHRITKGTTPTKSEIENTCHEENEIHFIKVNTLSENGTFLLNKLEKIPQSIHKGALRRSVLEEGDVLYTIAGTIGRVAIVQKEILPANINQAIALLRPNKERISRSFLYLLMSAKFFQEELHANIVQAVQANLSLTVLSNAKVVIPPSESFFCLFEPIEAIQKQMLLNQKESQTLIQIRDLLLPKLISGAVRVQDIEGAVA